jgi:dolichol-phosphate mannosyltransferase
VAPDDIEVGSARVLIGVPTYNEAANLPELVAGLLAVDESLRVLVVDDASPDGTGDVADHLAAGSSRVHVVHREGERGFAGASRAALLWGMKQGYDFVIMMDADLSHDPAVIPSMLEAAESHGADLVIGSRYVSGGGLVADWGWFRLAVSKLGSAYARLVVGTSARDCTSGYRCYRTSTLARVAPETTTSEGYFFQIEMLSRILDAGGAVAEVPITYIDRRRGESKISNSIIREAFWRTTQLGLRRAFTGKRAL